MNPSLYAWSLPIKNGLIWRSQIWSYFWPHVRRPKFQNQEHLALCRLPKVLLQLKICHFQCFSLSLSWLLATLESVSTDWQLRLSLRFLCFCSSNCVVIRPSCICTMVWASLEKSPAQDFCIFCCVLTFCCLSTFRLRETCYRKLWSSLNKSKHLKFSTWELLMKNYHIPVVSKLRISWTKH